MKKLYLLLFLATIFAGSARAQEGPAIPYLSDMSGWTVENAGGESGWQLWSSIAYFSPMSAAERELTGCDDGIACDTEDADSWAISPAIALKEGVEYSISFYMVVPDREVDYGDEYVALRVADGGSLAEISGGEELLSVGKFSSTELTLQSCTYTPAADGDYHFGLNCRSSDSMFGSYGIAATAFRIEGEEGGATSGISGAVAPVDARAEYFDITGRRVTKPVKGQLYIVRRGSKATKLILR